MKTVRRSGLLVAGMVGILFVIRSSESLLMKGIHTRSGSFRLARSMVTSSEISSAASYATVVIKRNRQSMEFRKGNQLVFEGAISYTSGSEQAPQMGDLVKVLVEQEKRNTSKKKKTSYKHVISPDDTMPTQILGWGVYNPQSLYRVRLLCHANLQAKLSKKLTKSHCDDGLSIILNDKLSAAMATREDLGLPNLETNTYRLFNGEGDGLSGLAVDILGGRVAVVMSSATWCQVHQETIQEVLRDLLPSEYEIVWRTTPSRLNQDGWEGSDEEGGTENEPSDEEVIVRESGISYKTYPFGEDGGQKTGFYCDQRDNRKNLAAFCNGKRVLDLCCYHGGFSLAAKLLGGASHCTGVDSSQVAIDICQENLKINELTEDISFVKDDIAKFMKEMGTKKQYWDVIVLDPPKLAPSVSGLQRASRKYHSLNRDAVALINPTEGGLLLTCTCSAAMTQKDGGRFFLETVQQAAAAAGRPVKLLQTSGAAPCHVQSPASYPAGAYLTAALFWVPPTSFEE